MNLLSSVSRRTLANSSDPWRRALGRGMFAYVMSRIFVLMGAAVVVASKAAQAIENDEVPESGTRVLARVLGGWDANWYMGVARTGYPHHVMPNVNYYVPDARVAFFPLFPRAIHYVDLVVPGGPLVVALAINLALGALFVYFVGTICRDLFDEKTAEKAMIIAALFPGSFVLSMGYSEALLLVLACLCFIALDRRLWLLAGILAALASATRPNGIALGAACAVTALIAIKNDKEWRSLIAPVVAPSGFIGFMWFLRYHTDENWAWFRVQTQAWKEGTSFGATAIQRTLSFFLNPAASATNTLIAGTMLAMVAALFLLRRYKLPVMYTAYSAVILALMLLPATVTARPRFLYTAFPLIFPVARALRDDDDKWWPVICTFMATGLTVTIAMYGVHGAVP